MKLNQCGMKLMLINEKEYLKRIDKKLLNVLKLKTLDFDYFYFAFIE